MNKKSVNSLKKAIKESGMTQEKWAESKDITPVTASRLVTAGCIVVDSVVYSPTKYKV